MPIKKLTVSITGTTKKDWQNKLKEINQFKLKEVSLFLESFSIKERRGLFKALKNSGIKKIPVVHIRHDTDKKEIAFLKKYYSSKYFTVHEDHFHIMDRWRGYYKNLYLEMNTDDRVKNYVKVKHIGGFCVDVAHFKVEVTKQTKEYRYVVDRMGLVNFGCNHLSGYSNKRNKDLHTPKSVKDFDYIKTLPHNIFGRVIAIEVYNPIKEQIKFQNHAKKILTKRLSFTII